MAWDMQLEGETGDLVFSPARDIAGVSAEEILRQRISIRCKIPRGTYLYDETGQLGSTLHLIPRSPSVGQITAAEASVLEALTPMSDEINVISVDVVKTEDNKLQVDVNFVPVLSDPDVPIYDTSSADVDAVSVTLAAD